MLLAKFSQHVAVDQVPLATYEAYFGSTGGDLWIEGNAMASPTSPSYVDDGAFHFESVDLRDHSTREAVVRGYTDLDSAASDESWGLDNIELWVR